MLSDAFQILIVRVWDRIQLAMGRVLRTSELVEGIPGHYETFSSLSTPLHIRDVPLCTWCHILDLQAGVTIQRESSASTMQRLLCTLQLHRLFLILSEYSSTERRQKCTQSTKMYEYDTVFHTFLKCLIRLFWEMIPNFGLYQEWWNHIRSECVRLWGPISHASIVKHRV